MLASSLGPLNPVTMETPEGARSDSRWLRTPLKWKQHQAEGGTGSAAPGEGASDSEARGVGAGGGKLCREELTSEGHWLPRAKVREAFPLLDKQDHEGLRGRRQCGGVGHSGAGEVVLEAWSWEHCCCCVDAGCLLAV